MYVSFNMIFSKLKCILYVLKQYLNSNCKVHLAYVPFHIPNTEVVLTLTPRFHDLFFGGENQRQQRYEREKTTTRGEGGHHGVHVFFILQRGIKAAAMNDNEQQPNGNKDNNENPRTKMIAERKDGQIRVIVGIHLRKVDF